MAYRGEHHWRDLRTGRYRSPAKWERNEFFKSDTLTRGLANFAFKTGNSFADEAEEFTAELVEYAKTHAPWTDRTGEARAGLDGAVTLDNDNLEIALFHTVDYGIWLEVRWGGKYAIIIPTVEEMGPKLYRRMQGKLGEIIYYE